MMMKEIGIFFIGIGVVLIIIGAGLVLFSHIKMPFDIVIKGKNYVIYLPIGTSILLSILLSLMLSLIFRR